MLRRVGGSHHHCGGQGLYFGHVEVGIRQRRGPSDQTPGSEEMKVAGNMRESPFHADGAKEPHKPLRRVLGRGHLAQLAPSQGGGGEPTENMQAGWGGGGGGTASPDKGECLQGGETSRRVVWSAVSVGR